MSSSEGRLLERRGAAAVVFGSFVAIGIVLVFAGTLTRATELDPKLPDAWQTRGALLARGGNVAEAEPAFAQAARLRPNDSRILADWARALWITGRREEAIQVGRAAVEAGAEAMRGLVAEWESARDEAPQARVP